VGRAARLAGAILVETSADFFLVGNTKRPCDWASAGFERPPEIDALASPYRRLNRSGPLVVPGPWLDLSPAVEGEALARVVAARFLIERNGSVSDRLWRLVVRADPEGDDPPRDAVIDGRWLLEMPAAVWTIVREKVLTCL
jgi:hypothetical protein